MSERVRLRSGFILLQRSPHVGYRGIDRPRFEPVLIDSEIGPFMDEKETGSDLIWSFYPKGWRRDAYKLFEENEVDAQPGELSLLVSLDVAHKIAEIVKPHVGPLEIFNCTVTNPNDPRPTGEHFTDQFVGYDLAYPGGDCYSAVLNGLILNPNQELYARFHSYLNDFGLFTDQTMLTEYLSDFVNFVESERESNFARVDLSLAFGLL